MIRNDHQAIIDDHKVGESVLQARYAPTLIPNVITL
jgi:hypothetical protein